MKNGGGWCESLTRKLVRSRLKWAGNVDRMEGEWLLMKRADALRGEGRMRRGRLRLRWGTA